MDIKTSHWYWDKENPTLFISGMHFLGIDFALLCDGWEEAKKMDNFCKNFEIPFKIFPARELGFEFAHIVCLIDEKFEEKMEKIPKENPWEFLRENASLVIFAHPAENWKAAYDGRSYQPLIQLYKKGFIDAIQIQSEKPYLEFKKENLKIGVVGGFDIHLCKKIRKYPEYVFKKNISPFKYIPPCSKWITIVFAEKLEEKEITKSVKEGKCVVFNPESFKFAGDKGLIEKLKKGNFIEKWKNQKREKEKIKIEANIFSGEKDISIIVNSPFKVDEIITSGETLSEPEKFKGNRIEKKIFPQYLERDNFYIPFTIKSEKSIYFYGVLLKSPVNLNFFSKVGKNLVPHMEVRIKNRTKKKKNLKLEVKIEKNKIEKEVNISPEKEKKLLLPFKDLKLNFEYPVSISIKSNNFERNLNSRISFPVAIFLEKGETPWKIDEKTSLKFYRKENIFHNEFWKGEDDLSAEMNLYWDYKNFYLYAKVKDDKFYQKWIGRETFWGDCLQFSFSPFLKKEDSYGSNYEIVISKTKRGPEIFMWYSFKNGERQVRKLSKKGKLEVVRKNKITEYRFSMPWSVFAPFKPEIGKRFLFSFVIFDNDGEIMKRKWIFYGGNIAVRKSMAGSHSVSMIKIK